MDETNLSNLAPAPASPEAVPGIGASASPELSQEQMKGNLQELMGKIESKYNEFGAAKASADNASKTSKSEMLREVFDLFESQGVDPNSPEEVGAFLDKIKETNPEIYAQIDQALRSLLGDSPELDTENQAGGIPTDIQPSTDPMTLPPPPDFPPQETQPMGGGAPAMQ